MTALSKRYKQWSKTVKRAERLTVVGYNRVMQKPTVYGTRVDPQTRCAHYSSELDIIAIKMACCQQFYACRECHDEVARHEAMVWPMTNRTELVVLCGVCAHQLTINEYLLCESRCPQCGSGFNPGCSKHAHLYFEVTP